MSRAAEASLPTAAGEFRLIGFRDALGAEHLALLRGQPANATLVRLHSECLTGDVFGSLRCDCGQQLERALEMIAGRGEGILLYLRQEGRGIGLVNKIRAYHLQDHGQDTVEANRALGFPDDGRDYAVAAAILHELGVGEVELLTNNPRKVDGLQQHGVKVLARVPLLVEANPANRVYLLTKRDKLGHAL